MTQAIDTLPDNIDALNERFNAHAKMLKQFQSTPSAAFIKALADNYEKSPPLNEYTTDYLHANTDSFIPYISNLVNALYHEDITNLNHLIFMAEHAIALRVREDEAYKPYTQYEQDSNDRIACTLGMQPQLSGVYYGIITSEQITENTEPQILRGPHLNILNAMATASHRYTLLGHVYLNMCASLAHVGLINHQNNKGNLKTTVQETVAKALEFALTEVQTCQLNANSANPNQFLDKTPLAAKTNVSPAKIANIPFRIN